MILRAATFADVPTLSALGRDSFCAAFEDLYRPEDLASFLGEAYSQAKVASEVAAPECIYCLAEDGGKLLGYCKMVMPSNYAEYSSASNPIALGQLYTAAGMTGKGIGAALMEWALDEAKACQADAVQLSVYSENYGAQRFYQRYGFGKIADIGFWVGQQRDAEFLYELRLG